MPTTNQYQLVDFGAARKLERFGSCLLDRPSPSAVGSAKRDPAAWEQADARYERGAAGQGGWVFHRTLAPAWTMRCDHLAFDLKFSKFGQVGLFPEQMACWRWIAEQICAAGRPSKVLNLFAYTGGSTLAAAAMGAEVTHVDAASGVVAWARRNAEASGLGDAPIRWIVDDAAKFARRELRRRQHYDAVILDPPSYGHGPEGEPWKLSERLGELLELCLELTARDRLFLLLTSHSGELAKATGLLKATLSVAPELRSDGALQAEDLYITSAAGGRLHGGAAVRWTAPPSGRPGAPASTRSSSRATRQR